MAADYDSWEPLDKLDEGGQATVYIARSPKSHERRSLALDWLFSLMKGQTPPGLPGDVVREGGRPLEVAIRERIPRAIKELAKGDGLPDDLGALKVFKLARDKSTQERVDRRLAQEVRALRDHAHPNILRLLHARVDKSFIVTEYHPAGSLLRHRDRFKGNALAAMSALLPLVEAVANLHANGIVHRDIKLANVFVADDGRLILGDFGIAYADGDDDERLTEPEERVGSRDWIPPSAHTGKRVDDVSAWFDVFMLAKLLWCMIAGERFLPHWFPEDEEYDLTRRFDDPTMERVNAILRRCITKKEEDCDLKTANMLHTVLRDTILAIERGGAVLREGEGYPCRVCGMGLCVTAGSAVVMVSGEPDDLIRHPGRTEGKRQLLALFHACDRCGHLDLFQYDPKNGLPPAWLPKRADAPQRHGRDLGRDTPTETRGGGFRIADPEGRLRARQEAYTLWRTLIDKVHGDQTALHDHVVQCESWYRKNALYLSRAAGHAFVDAYQAAANHPGMKGSPDMVRALRENWDVIMRAGPALEAED